MWNRFQDWHELFKEVAVSVCGLKKHTALALTGRLWRFQTSSGTASWLKTTLTRALSLTLTLVRHWLIRGFLGCLPTPSKLANIGHQSLCHPFRELSTPAWIKQGTGMCTLVIFGLSTDRPVYHLRNFIRYLFLEHEKQQEKLLRELQQHNQADMKFHLARFKRKLLVTLSSLRLGNWDFSHFRQSNPLKNILSISSFSPRCFDTCNFCDSFPVVRPIDFSFALLTPCECLHSLSLSLCPSFYTYIFFDSPPFRPALMPLRLFSLWVPIDVLLPYLLIDSWAWICNSPD